MVKLAKLFHVGGGTAPQLAFTLAPEKIKFCKDWLRGEENLKKLIATNFYTVASRICM